MRHYQSFADYLIGASFFYPSSNDVLREMKTIKTVTVLYQLSGYLPAQSGTFWLNGGCQIHNQEKLSAKLGLDTQCYNPLMCKAC
jgi:hypothetical protein